MNTKRRKTGFRKWMLLLIFSVVTVFACVATACGEKGHSHEWVEHAATDSTCTVAGHELYYTCGGCEKIFDAQKNEISAIPEKPLVPHEWGEGVKTADPTCTHGEEFTYTCSVGGETKKEYVGEALGHTFGDYTYNDDATCVDEGTQSAVCSRCGETDYKSYPALGHELGEIIPETNVKCQENLAAHYRCSRCEGYFNADREKTTLEGLTIPAVHNWQKTTTVLRHSLECLDCGKSYEGLHEFDSLSDFVCNDPDCAYERDHDRQIVNWFENENGVARLNWDDGSQYTRSFVTLPREIGKPAGALDVGDKAFKMTTKAGCGDAYPVIRLSGVTDCLKDYNDADYLLIWTYLTGTQGVDGLFLLGNTREDGIFYDGDPGQSYGNNTHLPKLGASGEWRAIRLTVAELKSALQKQGSISAEWAFIYFNVSSETDIYLYSVELHRESAQAITVKGDAANYVTVADCAVPMSKVAFTVQDLPYGSFVRIIDDATGLEIHSAVGSGTFVMPYAGVTVEVVDLFAEDALQSITTNVRRSNRIALPAIYDDWQDSCILTVLKNGSTVSEESYRYNAASGEIVFYGGGTYTLTYTLKKEGAEDKTLTRTITVHGAIMSYLTEAERTAYYEWTPNVTSEYVALPSSVGKPAGAEDIGDYARKYEMNGDWEFAPVLYLGDLLTRTDLRDSDYIRIWIYSTSVHYNNACNAYWFGNVNENGKFSEATDNKTTYSVADEYANINKWHAYQITLGDLRAQLAKQNLQSAEWLRFGMGPHDDATLYVYSVELRQENAREITVANSANSHVTVAQSAYPREEVAVTISGLAYGQSVVIMNAETSEIVKVISENGETSFIMPYGNVSVSFVNVFENTELEEIATNIYRTDNIAIPSLFDGWYDSFTLTVKKGDAVVAASEYEYDEENHTILFVEGGAYELTYTLKKNGAADVELTRTVTVSGAIASFTTGADVAAEMSWGTEQYSSELAELPDEVKKPSQSVDVGNKAWKFTVQNAQYYIAPTIYMGDLLQNLNKLNNGDMIRIWIYRTGSQWADTNCYWLGNLNENGKFQTDIAGQQYNDKKDIPVFGTANAWYALDISVADLKTQMIKQGLTSATHLQLFLNFDQNSTAYIYSVEIVKASAQTVTIDSTAQEHVSGLSETQLPLETVTFTVSGLGDGEAICVVNNSSNEKVLTVTENGEASFVMPYAGVTVKIINLTSPTVVESFDTMDSVKTITWSQESGTTRELVSAATEGIGTPDGAVKKGGNILKCTISGDDNWQAITVIKIGDLLQEPETLKDNDTVKIWVYFTDEHWDNPDGTIYFVGGLNGDGKFDPVWDNRTSMPNTASCAKGTWGAITFTAADLKAAAEKKSGDGTGWMYLQFNMNVNSVVYIYSVELYPA